MSDGLRPAATVILWRLVPDGPEVLMGQRGAGAVFMPSKYVFPGGGVDAGDHPGPSDDRQSGEKQSGNWLAPECHTRLTQFCAEDAPSPRALVAAALRELAEETGLSLRAASGDPALRFVFRAITPPGRPRRFDARFFLVPASRIAGDPQDFTAASGELTHLHWVGLARVRALDLPFITEVVLAEVEALLSGLDQPGVPFFDNSGPVPTFRRIV